MKATLYQYALKNISVVDGDTLKADIDLGFGVAITNKKSTAQRRTLLKVL